MPSLLYCLTTSFLSLHTHIYGIYILRVVSFRVSCLGDRELLLVNEDIVLRNRTSLGEFALVMQRRGTTTTTTTKLMTYARRTINDAFLSPFCYSRAIFHFFFLFSFSSLARESNERRDGCKARVTLSSTVVCKDDGKAPCAVLRAIRRISIFFSFYSTTSSSSSPYIIAFYLRSSPRGIARESEAFASDSKIEYTRKSTINRSSLSGTLENEHGLISKIMTGDYRDNDSRIRIRRG